ncbi:unnamed protein product [Rotaria magnacalcarata]
MMDVHENQQNLISNVSKLDIDEENPTEVTPLTNSKANEEEEEEEEVAPFMIPELYNWSTSLLSQICREGDIHRLRLFIEFSRQISSCAQLASNIIDRLDVDTGLSPLHHAARHQQLNVCIMILSNIKLVSGVNIKDEYDRTPMYSALRLSNHTLDPANEVLSEDDFGNQFQDFKIWQQEYNDTILSSHHPLIYLFARTNGDINARDKYLLTPLHYAVARQNLAGVKQLIALNADIESEDRQGIRPLHIACKEGYFSIVEYLIEQGAKLDVVDADSWTPIHYACAKGHLDIVKLTYLKHESYFKKILVMKTNNDATCFHLVVESGNILLVKYVLTKFTRDNIKLLINEQVEPFGSPLHIAV